MKNKLLRLTDNQISYIDALAQRFGITFTEMIRRLLDELIEIKKGSSDATHTEVKK